MTSFRIVVLLAIALTAASSAFAQSRGSSRINGKVVDEQGKPVADVVVKAQKVGQTDVMDGKTMTPATGAGPRVDASGEFHPDALERTFAAVDQYAELIKKAGVGVEKVHFVATSATRDVKNRDSFFAGIKERLGVPPDVISGEIEAHLSFNGALSRVTPGGEPARPPAN